MLVSCTIPTFSFGEDAAIHRLGTMEVESVAEEPDYLRVGPHLVRIADLSKALEVQYTYGVPSTATSKNVVEDGNASWVKDGNASWVEDGIYYNGTIRMGSYVRWTCDHGHANRQAAIACAKAHQKRGAKC